MTEIADIYKGKVPVEYVEHIPTDVPDAHFREYLQSKIELGVAHAGWDQVTATANNETSNALWEGHRWKTPQETLGI